MHLICDHAAFHLPFFIAVLEFFDHGIDFFEGFIQLRRPFFFSSFQLRGVSGELVYEGEGTGEGGVEGCFIGFELWGGWRGDEGEDVATGEGVEGVAEGGCQGCDDEVVAPVAAGGSAFILVILLTDGDWDERSIYSVGCVQGGLG